jgi:aspartyl protease family protein
MAEELDLVPQGVVLVQTPNSSAVPFKTTTLNSIKVGGHTLRNIEVAVSPSLPLGLLGQDFFRNFDLTIKEKVIEFKKR